MSEPIYFTYDWDEYMAQVKMDSWVWSVAFHGYMDDLNMSSNQAAALAHKAVLEYRKSHPFKVFLVRS